MKVTITNAHIRIYRAVEGAVRNTADGHPNWPLTEEMARSIAKRATGTLTAAWPDVLAAHRLPSDAGGPGNVAQWPPRRFARKRSVGERRYGFSRRSPLRQLWNEVSSMVGPAKRAGQTERAEALIDVLRAISRRI